MIQIRTWTLTKQGAPLEWHVHSNKPNPGAKHGEVVKAIELEPVLDLLEDFVIRNPPYQPMSRAREILRENGRLKDD